MLRADPEGDSTDIHEATVPKVTHFPKKKDSTSDHVVKTQILCIPLHIPNVTSRKLTQNIYKHINT